MSHLMIKTISGLGVGLQMTPEYPGMRCACVCVCMYMWDVDSGRMRSRDERGHLSEPRKL